MSNFRKLKLQEIINSRPFRNCKIIFKFIASNEYSHINIIKIKNKKWYLDNFKYSFGRKICLKAIKNSHKEFNRRQLFYNKSYKLEIIYKKI